MNTEETERLVCQHVLRRLGEGGQPPEHGIMRINVGNESYLAVLEDEYFGDLLRHGSAFKLVQGYFGAGKTHFLLCVREMAWANGFAAALVELSPEECPYDDSLLTYAATARNIAVAGRGPLDPPRAGLGEVLRESIVRRRRASLRLVEEDDDWADPAPSAQDEASRDIGRWLADVEAAPCESLSYRRAVVSYLRACIDEDRRAQQKLEAWLAAEPIPVSELRDQGVYETMSRKNGFLMLRSMTQMLAVGYDGVALLFDEVDRNMSFNAKRSQSIGDNLRQVVDLCGRHQLPKTLFVYAVPPEFMRAVVPDYPALYQRLKSPTNLGVRSPQAVLIDLDDLDLAPTAMLSELASRILDVFECAYGSALGREVQLRNGRLLAASCVHTQFEVNHRRLFVKTFVDLLHRQRYEGQVELDEDSALDLVLDGYEGSGAW